MASAPLTKLLNLEEVADLLRVSPHTVRSWVAKGRLRPVRICRRLLFAPIVVQQLIADGTGPETQL